MTIGAKLSAPRINSMVHEKLIKLGIPAQLAGAFCFVGRFAWPSVTGGAGGIATLQATEWKHPTITYVFISLIIQLGIELLRSAVRERRERFDAAQKQADSIAATYEKAMQSIETAFQKVIAQIESSAMMERRVHQIYRHSFFNQLNAIATENDLLRVPGCDASKIPHVKPFIPELDLVGLNNPQAPPLTTPT